MATSPPLAGSLNVSSPYGQRDGVLHDGIDYAAAAGTKILATLSGKVVTAGYSSGGWGYEVVLDNGTVNGQHIYTRYAHMQSQPAVKVGQAVTAGTTLGGVGQTGDATGNHLHYAEYVGSPVSANSVNPAGATAPGNESLLDKAKGAVAGALGSGLDAITPDWLQQIAEAVTKFVGEFVTKAQLLEKIATSITKLFLPSNLLRVAAGLLAVVLLLFALFFLGKELVS